MYLNEKARLTRQVHVTVAFALLLAPAAGLTKEARRPEPLREVVVTAARMTGPLVVSTDPRAPRQPLPAHDGADYLKTVPGFAVIRKGGTDGDPVFRGMAASRINILLDGEQALGGCGMRMDPPTAYIFPEAFDRVVVIKGPQTVLHGPGNSAATVMFERDRRRLDGPATSATGSLLAGSFDRADLIGALRLGNERLQGELQGSHAQAGDYRDGAGRRVNSQYQRWSGNAALAWTPDDVTRLELTAVLSDGEAAYADRRMDGVKFARDSLGLRFERELAGEFIRRVEAQAYASYVDHVMDNYSLREFVPTTMMPGRAVSNPDRETLGGRFSMDLDLQRATATVGLDAQENVHTLRMTSNQDLLPYQGRPRVEDANFANTGVFAEAQLPVGEHSRVVTGLRADQWKAQDLRQTLQLGMSSVPNPTANAQRRETLLSGFARHEYDTPSQPITLYAGLGHVERFPDYWELVSAGKESLASTSAFNTEAEKTTQIDVGLLYSGARFSLALSGFISNVDDYILIQSGVVKGMRTVTVTRNIDATTWGAEADASVQLGEAWTAIATLAHVRGENQTDGGPLGQMAPFEARLGLNYEQGAWSFGSLLRAVAAQDRFATGQGNIVGQDLGRSPGFAIFSLNGAWRPRPDWQVSVGIDNVFDREYAEHLSRGGVAITGFERTTRVNEPGRTLWLKAGIALR